MERFNAQPKTDKYTVVDYVRIRNLFSPLENYVDSAAAKTPD